MASCQALKRTKRRRGLSSQLLPFVAKFSSFGLFAITPLVSVAPSEAQVPTDFYKRVITVADSMDVNGIAGISATDRCETVIINGGIRLGSLSSPDDTSWVDCLLDYEPSFIEVDPLRGPDVNLFFSQHSSGPGVPEVESTGPTVIYDFHGDASQVEYYTWPESGTDFTLFENRPATLTVTGHNVWMLASGLRCVNRVRVEGDPATSSLVIVAGRNGTYSFESETYYDAGIWFFAGIESEIPLILVSDGGVYIEQFHITHHQTQHLPYLSVYSGYAFITGPEKASGQHLELSYNPSMDDLIDWLATMGALPSPFAETQTISISDASAVEGDAGTTSIDFTISLSSTDGANVTVDYFTASGTANELNDDYIAVSATATIPAGSLSTIVTVLVNGDLVQESDETFSVILSNPSGATLGDAAATGTIENDDDQPTLVINDQEGKEGFIGTTAFAFTVSLSNPTDTEVTVDFATADGKATVADNDYLPVSGTATIPAKLTQVRITVFVIGDTELEIGNGFPGCMENFFVNLTNPIGASLEDNQGEGRIFDGACADPVVLQRFEAFADYEGVELRWQFSDADQPASVTVERADDEDGPWAEVSVELSNEDGVTVALDRTVAPLTTYYYRLVVRAEGEQPAVFGLVSITSVEALVFALGAIVPNPMRTVVRIGYAVGSESRVKLSVFDIQGREVAVLAEGLHHPGRHQATWHGGRGHRASAPGLYLVRYLAPGKQFVRRIAIIR